jgi:uncharacterized membrane protein SirB2
MTMDVLKTLHIGCVLLSGTGFALRSIWMWRGSPWLQARTTRILPHVVDSLLLISAILLAVRIHQYPLIHGWLTAKVAALVLYIVFGMIALKRGRTRLQRTLAALAAMAVFVYIVAVAVTRAPLPVPFPAG